MVGTIVDGIHYASAVFGEIECPVAYGIDIPPIAVVSDALDEFATRERLAADLLDGTGEGYRIHIRAVQISTHPDIRQFFTA